MRNNILILRLTATRDDDERTDTELLLQPELPCEAGADVFPMAPRTEAVRVSLSLTAGLFRPVAESLSQARNLYFLNCENPHFVNAIIRAHSQRAPRNASAEHRFCGRRYERPLHGGPCNGPPFVRTIRPILWGYFYMYCISITNQSLRFGTEICRNASRASAKLYKCCQKVRL